MINSFLFFIIRVFWVSLIRNRKPLEKLKLIALQMLFLHGQDVPMKTPLRKNVLVYRQTKGTLFVAPQLELIFSLIMMCRIQLRWLLWNKIPIWKKCAMNLCLKCKNLELLIKQLILIYLFFSSVSEENFWRNYFYRVSLICQANEVSCMAREGGSHSGDSTFYSDQPMGMYPLN